MSEGATLGTRLMKDAQPKKRLRSYFFAIHFVLSINQRAAHPQDALKKYKREAKRRKNIYEGFENVCVCVKRRSLGEGEYSDR